MVAPEDYETILVGDLGEDKSLISSSKLSVEMRDSLIEFLKNNVDLFTWKLEDMLSVNPSIKSHELNIDNTKQPIQQGKNRFG